MKPAPHRRPRPPIPFPIDDGRYVVSAAVRVLGRPTADGHVERGHFRIDTDTPDYLRDKLSTLHAGHGRSRAIDAPTAADRQALGETIIHVAERIADEHPGWVRRCDDGIDATALGIALRWTADGGCAAHEAVRDETDPELTTLRRDILAWLQGVDGISRRLDAVALLVPEDLVVVRAASADRPDALEALHVCFASSWTPSEKVGRDFSAVHAPVVDNEPLLRAHHGLVRLICGARPYVRYAWGLHRDTRLCHDPMIAPQAPEPINPTPDEAAAATVFRVERQTTFGRPDLGRGVFTIRVYRQAIDLWATDADRCDRLSDALAGMTPQQLEYKGLVQRRDPLVAWLRIRAGELRQR